MGVDISVLAGAWFFNKSLCDQERADGLDDIVGLAHHSAFGGPFDTGNKVDGQTYRQPSPVLVLFRRPASCWFACWHSFPLSPKTGVSVKHSVHTRPLMCVQHCRWYEYMNVTPIQESSRPDRFFAACIDGRETMFVLHADHGVCIARATQPVALVEPSATILAELLGLAL